ncbi:MAG: hypothetical protein JGK28_23830 [Microcoleus sp. PH2017_07_MST_O_A]|jgi:hypothetical protein|uniref:hypothetical protein n=1 Tax=unclassified Microcoleus TaxID=2642155 RepID=UPI001DCD8BDF|nr:MULTISPECIES: hypothetical protein [unclassified Microcoleus]MCC3416242.1 hypothetical protein [Microcoleus sp. PH2017_02_FOX_O_A]MCC3420855.1 hypothetical protein [Microcoleus sp. PH2017_07_MST_O_A]MCC3444785.1 hypothetical protein [Microcoleus sp. PH2017_03_ELD_O_A]TAE05159.1 MAG: hypothetical protein EAZ94_32675 [Oscillatoriales cyanobacterium]TAE30582.1 MAG: hypothetical protein EAZ93_00675 [Oscillatoriales cyanobacterium]
MPSKAFGIKLKAQSSKLKLTDIILNKFMIAQNPLNPLLNSLEPPDILRVLQAFFFQTLLDKSLSFFVP